MNIEQKIAQLENYIGSNGQTPLSPDILADLQHIGGSQHNSLPWPKKHGWTLYGRSSCPYCQSALNRLKGKVDFIDLESRNIDKQDLLNFLRTDVDPKNQSLKTHDTVPLIFKDGKFIGGSDDL